MILLAILLAALPSAALAQDASTATVMSVSTAPVSLSTPAAAVAPEIRVVWPAEASKYPFLKRSYVFGSVTPGSTLTVNGTQVQPRASGAFLAMVDFSTGTFELRFSAQLGGLSTATIRAVSVSDALEALAEKSRIVVLEPKEDLTLRFGDWLSVRARGPAGAQAHFEVDDLSKDQPLEELESGLYEGRWRVPGGKEGRGRRISIHMKTKDGKLKAEAPGKLSLLEGGRFQVAVTTAMTAILKTSAGGYDLFMPPGILLAVSGSAGPRLRIVLSPEDEAWVESAQVRLLPKGTPPPSGTVGKYLSTAVSSSSVQLSVQVDKNLPFEVYESMDPLTFDVRFYGAQQRIDRIHYGPNDPVIRDVRWRQESAQVVKLTVQTKLKWGSGYDAYYEKGRFILEIRRPALIGSPNAFAGLRIVLDPGHGPDRGALGPMGSEEQGLNLALASNLKKLLEKEGAEVFLTRTDSAGPPLYERPGLAWGLRGDMLISIHNNALAVTDDPFESPRGFMNLYYQPHSRPLADAMHAAYASYSPLPDEALHWGDLHVCRITQMPAVLTESAYVMLPEQEELLLSASGQDLFARTMLEGARGYFEAVRKLQAESEDERRAARKE